MAVQKNFVCTTCPMGCRLTVTRDDAGEITVTGNTCVRGERYGKAEFTDPQRTVTSSVWVTGGHMRLVSVRTRSTVSKTRIPDVLNELKKCTVEAPIRVGDVLIPDVAGTGVDVIATRNIDRI